MRKLVVVYVALICLTGCSDRPLRGSVEKSVDGRTYLVVADDNGGACGPIKLDGRIWPHRISEPGLVSPGRHKIECGSDAAFDIPTGTTFRFDYWGP